MAAKLKPGNLLLMRRYGETFGLEEYTIDGVLVQQFATWDRQITAPHGLQDHEPTQEMVIDRDGSVYLTMFAAFIHYPDPYSSYIIRFDPHGNRLDDWLIASKDYLALSGVKAIDIANRYLYVVVQEAGSPPSYIRRYTLPGGDYADTVEPSYPDDVYPDSVGGGLSPDGETLYAIRRSDGIGSGHVGNVWRMRIADMTWLSLFATNPGQFTGGTALSNVAHHSLVGTMFPPGSILVNGVGPIGAIPADRYERILVVTPSGVITEIVLASLPSPFDSIGSSGSIATDATIPDRCIFLTVNGQLFRYDFVPSTYIPLINSGPPMLTVEVVPKLISHASADSWVAFIG